MPVPITIALLLLGIVLMFRRSRRSQVLAKVSIASALFVLVFASTPYFSNTAIEAYEPAFIIPNDVEFKFIHVLGCSHRSHPQRSATAVLHDCSARRLMEGLRLKHQFPSTKLILSGYGPFDEITNAQAMADAAISLGIKQNDILVLNETRDTEEEAIAASKIVGQDAVVLVSSASHLPRAIALFKRAGIDVYPSASDFLSEPDGTIPWYMSPPHSRYLQKTERALYEWMGNLYENSR